MEKVKKRDKNNKKQTTTIERPKGISTRQLLAYALA
jgi:hypothetical protein